MAQFIDGLPEPLPEGERVLWQGKPDTRSLLLHAFHLRKLAIYFAVILLLRGLFAVADGATIGNAIITVLWLVPLALAALGLVAVIGVLTARSTIYAITDRRIVMRIGVVLQITFNIPFRTVEGAELNARRDGSGDVPMQLNGDDHLAWLHLWPHVRPWRVAHPEPMLRCVPDALRVAQLLAQALAEHAGIAARAITPTPEPQRMAVAPPPFAVAGD